MTRLGPTDYRAPHRLARLLIALRVPAEEREFVKGDLDEGMALVRQERGRWIALVWYARQLTSLLVNRRIAAASSPSLSSQASRNELSMPTLFDLRMALRSLRRAPLFSTLVMFTLVIGIGATLAVFNVVYSALLAPPPYPDPDRLVVLWERSSAGEKENIGWLTGTDISKETRSFSSVAMISYWGPIARFGEHARQLNGIRVSHTYFRTLGVRPLIGRDFTPEEDQSVATRRVAILSFALWRSLYGGDTSIVGKSASINGVPYLIAGVMPKGFRDVFTPLTEIWGPLGYSPDYVPACRTCRHLRAIARLRPEVSLTAARQELDVFQQSLKSRHPTEYASVGMTVPTLQTETGGRFKPSLLGLLGAVTLLLALACINVGNLFLGRSGEKHQDLVIRMALGADRGRLLGLVSLEALILALSGGGLGALVGWYGSRKLLTLQSIPPALADGASPLVPMIGIALLASVVAALIGGSLPALLTLRESALQEIRVGTRSVSNRLRHRLRHGIVIAEVALAVILLASAGLQVRTLRHALSVDPGFDPAGVTTTAISLVGPQYDSAGSTRTFYRNLLGGVEAIPGVEAAAVVNQLPLGGNFDASGVHREDRTQPNPELDPSAQRFAVSPGYFDAMRIALLRGRPITPADREGSDPVAWLNRSGATRIFGTDDPIGKRIKMGGMDGPWYTVVGIVEDVRHLSLDGEIENQMYLPFDQNQYEESALTLVTRGRGEVRAFEPGVSAAIKRLDPGAATSAMSMNEVVRRQLGARRLALSLIGGFAVIALILALGGLFGVVSASVTERLREIGVRSALGATPGRLIRMVAAQGLGLVLAGTAIGIGGMLAARGIMTRFVVGVSPGDPLNFVGVAGLLGLVAMMAMIVPAVRASRVDPLTVMRSE